jgi:catechol-2,3-dioxygenase
LTVNSLDDLEDNNIELYVRSLDDGKFEIVNGQMQVRYADGRIGSGRDPLDLEALFHELDENDRLDVPLPEGTRIGHIHLYTSGLDSSMNFYANILGFEQGRGGAGRSAATCHRVEHMERRGDSACPGQCPRTTILYDCAAGFG